MTALYILLGIVLFFALLFSVKLKVYVRLTDALRVKAGLGPVLLTLVPKKKKSRPCCRRSCRSQSPQSSRRHLYMTSSPKSRDTAIC